MQLYFVYSFCTALQDTCGPESVQAIILDGLLVSNTVPMDVVLAIGKDVSLSMFGCEVAWLTFGAKQCAGPDVRGRAKPHGFGRVWCQRQRDGCLGFDIRWSEVVC